MDRAFVDPDSGNTTCVWEAPDADSISALFEKAGVTVKSVREVEEVTASETI